jgi:hypothetical protein
MDQVICLLIRAKLQNGLLPHDIAPTSFGRPGNGQRCDACEEILTTVSLMMEVYSLATDRKSFRFHGDCYMLWDNERRALKS